LDPVTEKHPVEDIRVLDLALAGKSVLDMKAVR
jgi:hypothetical protein